MSSRNEIVKKTMKPVLSDKIDCCNCGELTTRPNNTNVRSKVLCVNCKKKPKNEPEQISMFKRWELTP